jgi:acetate kinase
VRVAVLNAGSGTVKVALVEVGAAATAVCARRVVDLTAGTCSQSVFAAALDAVGDGAGVDAVGHRVVHGGRRFTRTVRIDPTVEQAIDALAKLAPLHNPLALEGIRAARDRFPGRPMVAVFDTAFHSRRPPESLRYPLPWETCESLDLFRYGFHGIAHESLVQSLATEERIEAGEVTAVTLQLGAGCSACAVERGRSIETSMGLSPLGGLPMATRSGDLDPAVVLELVRRGHALNEVEEMLTHRSGLKGLAGEADVRSVLRAEARGDERAALAIALFVRRIVALAGAYFTLLGGAGALVFGGGIGTHSTEIRRRVAAGLFAWGVDLDPVRNAGDICGRISRDGTRPVYTFETDEERLIARSVHALLQPEKS